MQATALTEPEVHVLYRLDGGVGPAERGLGLAGYRGSRPVRVGNAALDQVQHDIYGALLETAALFSEGERALDRDTGAVLARIADHVCDIWRRPDAGIWEVRNGRFHFTHSKVMCWVALDRALRMAGEGELPAGHAARWRREAAAIRAYVDRECWSEELQTTPASPAAGRRRQPPDAAAVGYRISGGGCAARSTPSTRRCATATCRSLPRRRRRAGGEGSFLNCSFWLVSALARGALGEATAPGALAARANDVGLYAEEVDPGSGAFLGNFPRRRWSTRADRRRARVSKPAGRAISCRSS